MYPTLALLNPTLAESCLLYRMNHLSGAREKAQSYRKQYSGTMFPWESAFSGTEVCPPSAPTGELEQHISGDVSIAYGIYKRLLGTENLSEKMKEIGWEMVEGIAIFWKSRVQQVGQQYQV